MTRALGDGWLLPALDDANRPFFTRGRLAVPACADCGRLQFPPAGVCGGCQGARLAWRESRGEGRVESVAVVHHPVHRALADAVPYAIAVVSLDDAPGVHLVGNVVGCAPSEVAIGLRVRVSFEEVADPDSGATLRIPQWWPAPAAPDPGT